MSVRGNRVSCDVNCAVLNHVIDCSILNDVFTFKFRWKDTNWWNCISKREWKKLVRKKCIVWNFFRRKWYILEYLPTKVNVCSMFSRNYSILLQKPNTKAGGTKNSIFGPLGVRDYTNIRYEWMTPRYAQHRLRLLHWSWNDAYLCFGERISR